jgi:hypothetical protein
MVILGVQVGGLNIQGYPPTPAVTGDGGEKDLAPLLV